MNYTNKPGSDTSRYWHTRAVNAATRWNVRTRWFSWFRDPVQGAVSIRDLSMGILQSLVTPYSDHLKHILEQFQGKGFWKKWPPFYLKILAFKGYERPNWLETRIELQRFDEITGLDYTLLTRNFGEIAITQTYVTNTRGWTLKNNIRNSSPWTQFLIETTQKINFVRFLCKLNKGNHIGTEFTEVTKELLQKNC